MSDPTPGSSPEHVPAPATPDPAAPDGLVGAATTLAGTVAEVRLPLPLPSAETGREVQRQLADQFRDHLLPRLLDRGAPLLAVVGGSTGAGKSTLVNSLVGDAVSRTGVLRPTTRAPVLVHHPADLAAFRGDRILPGLRRAVLPSGSVVGSSDPPAPDVLSLVPSQALSSGLALLDAPDIDSVDTANRLLARQLLGAADLWLFVTTPARYADAVPWELLRTAARRGTSVAVVLDRVEAPERREVVDHLRRLLDEAGLDRAALLVVPAVAPTADGLLPASAVEAVVEHLEAVAGDERARREVADATLRGALASVADRVGIVEDAVEDQVGAAQELARRCDVAHDHAVATILDAIDDGRVLRGEVLARWHDFVGAGDLLRWLESGVGRLRDRVQAMFRRGRRPEEQLTEAVEDGLAAVVVDALQRARRDTVRAWRAGAGADLVDPGLATPSGLSTAARELVRDWQDEVVDLVRDQAGDKRNSARMVALGLNGAAAALMVAVFASTGGLTGAEVGVAGGTSVVAQRLLEAILGDQAVRSMTAQARDALVRRVRALTTAEAAGFRTALDDLALDPTWPARLGAEQVELDVARREAGL
ncbi:ABC transporter [Salsipaludibacter albus]|uniref:ABC transporter n=1 Tax=Salsipaludibacter albus TaxID=2849650 RepID=UPI001EE3C127|nr:ABC transporter [Salsipaludibacter albus]MBY5161852.1 ABC transporter [Salsipaludibacter albus]